MTESRLLKARYQILVTPAISTAVLVFGVYVVVFEHIREDITSYVVLTALALSIATVQLMRYYGRKMQKIDSLTLGSFLAHRDRDRHREKKSGIQ